MSLTLVLTVLAAYVAVLFAAAAWGDGRARVLDASPARRAWLYALALGVYCTSWTFYGAVGEAARNGWDYLPIYLGPALVFLIGFPVVRRMVELGRRYDTASIAEFLSARYGKSTAVGALAAGGLLLAVIPYIALQLKGAATSLGVLTGLEVGAGWAAPVAAAFAGFAILFGQRKPDSAEGHRGLVLAVALESVVKIVALAAVGALALALLTGGPSIGEITAAAPPLAEPGLDLRFAVITLLAALAALTLPRQFHMMVAEAREPADAEPARWIFPGYLLLVALVAPPIALAGAGALGAANPDSYVIALPLSAGSQSLALLAFLGGFSAAAGMVTVAALAMSTMLVNDIAAPLIIRGRGLQGEGGLAARMLTWRRLAVIGLVAAAYVFQLGLEPEAPLASLGLVAFAGAAQLGPALIFGLFWRRANRAGALAGLGAGLALWVILILIPSYTGWRPPAPDGVDAFALFSLISLAVNALAFITAVAFFSAGLVDQLQADAFTGKGGPAGPSAPGARIADLEAVLTRVLGDPEARAAMAELSRAVGRALKANDAPTPAVIALAEARLARSVGAASARILMTRVIAGSRVSPGDVVALIDETAEKLRTSEDRLEESERSIRFYTDNLPALLSYADRSYRLRFANRGYLEFFGLDESAIGTPLADFMSEEEYALRRAHMEAALNGERQIFDISRKTGGGRKRSWQVVYQPRIEDGEVVGFFGVYQDNTARRQAEEGLKRAYDQMERRVDERTAELRAEAEARGRLAEDLERARAEAEAATRSKTRFLAAASHDLLQPLSAARLFAGALEDALKQKDPDEAETARRIERSIEQADRLLRALLDISRLDAGGITPSPSVFSLGELIEETAAQFTARAQAEGLTLVAMPTRLAVFSDRGLMTSVLQNLISNAVRYTETGAVLIGARRRGRDVVLQVIDTGAGVAEDKQRSIFREFDRGGRTDERDRGLGLGLAVTDRICKTLGHRLTLRSEIGRGSCFEVRLPRASSQPARRRPARTRAGALDGVTVLCVEDEAEVRESMIALMARWGCEARGAVDRAGAEAAFDGAAPDLVVLDYQLAGGETGPDVYAALCARWNAAPPGLLVTAERGQAAADAAAQAGLELVQKPAAPAVLRASLSALRRRI